jgi:crossover junction endonuclease EME1
VDIGVHTAYLYSPVPVSAHFSLSSIIIALAIQKHILSIVHPLRLREQAINTTFCMDYGQVRSGDDAADIFVRMLQEMVQITAAVAYGIVAEYPTVRDLVGVLQRDGPLALQDCRKTANKNGAFTDRRVGPSISKRVHKVFTSSDEWCLNV